MWPFNRKPRVVTKLEQKPLEVIVAETYKTGPTTTAHVIAGVQESDILPGLYRAWFDAGNGQKVWPRQRYVTYERALNVVNGFAEALRVTVRQAQMQGES